MQCNAMQCNAMQCNATNSCVRAWKPVAFVFSLRYMNFLSCSKPLWVALIWSNCCGVGWVKISQSDCCCGCLFQFLRQEREFPPFSLMLRDEIENFFLSISCFETRTGISFINLRHRDENENRDWDNSRENFRELHLLLVYWQIFSKKDCYFLKISKNNTSFFLEKFE